MVATLTTERCHARIRIDEAFAEVQATFEG